VWEDTANLVARLVSLDASQNIYVKATSSETWSGAITGVTATGYLADFANYKGNLYFSVAASTSFDAAPGALYSFDGTTIRTSPLGGEGLFSLTVTPFLDRLVFGYVKATVVNQLGTTNAYSPAAWSAITTTTTNITNGSAVTGRITPTATTGSVIYKADQYTIAAATTETSLVQVCDLKSVSPVYDMPMTPEIYYSEIWVLDTAMTVGAIRVPTVAGGNGYRYRVTATAGDTKTHNTTEPTWPTTVGTTVVDDQVTWICDGPDAIGSQPSFLTSPRNQTGRGCT
jgi:hypothetical protein